MTDSDPLGAFPRDLKASSSRPDQTYGRVPDRFAIRGPCPPELRAAVELELHAEQIVICHGVPPDSISPLPVYRLAPAGAPSVATGRIFVRLRDAARIEDHEAELRATGYCVAERLPYAPNAAWLDDVNDDVGAALNNVGHLEAIDAVVNVEPQVLQQRHTR